MLIEIGPNLANLLVHAAGWIMFLLLMVGVYKISIRMLS